MPFFQAISTLFGGGGSRAPRREGSADAFSLPTTNLTEMHGAGDGSPGPSRRGSYMPAGYPSLSDSPTNTPGRPTGLAAQYPPPSHTFHRLRNVLAEPFPELMESINPPVHQATLAAFERELGTRLPASVRESFLVADGQDLEGNAGGIFYGLYLLPLDEVMREWAFWRQAETDPRVGANPAVLATMASIPPQWVKGVYACRGWIPLLSDRSGNYVGVDIDPGPGGSWGQAIIFGRDFDRKCVLFRGEGEGGWAKWLASFVDELESGETWEADKSSDGEEELGYSSYAGGQTYGDEGLGLRLAGQYKGWGVLEAWWDKSVRKWEGLGLGMDVAEVERGMSEARRLTGNQSKDKGKGKDRESAEIENIRAGQRAADSEIPSDPAPSTPNLGDTAALLGSPQDTTVPRILHSHHSPTRVSTTRATTTDHPLKPGSDYLQPPSRSSSRTAKKRKPPPPAPTPLDLPTRADVQAAQAVAQAEASGLRGGWVMNLDTSAGAASRRLRTHNISPSLDAEMVDIDLEGGRLEAFGTPPMRAEDVLRQEEADRLSHAGIEHRQMTKSPVLLTMSRTPSPLSRPLSRAQSPDNASGDSHHTASTERSDVANSTPRGSIAALNSPPATSPAGSRPSSQSSMPSSVAAAASNTIRLPPPISQYADSPARSVSPAGDIEREVVRGARRPSNASPIRERENSVMSIGSQDGLLDTGRAGSATPPFSTPSTRTPVMTVSPPKMNGGQLVSEPKAITKNVDHLADGLEEVDIA